jgi:hypothetical protein
MINARVSSSKSSGLLIVTVLVGSLGLVPTTPEAGARSVRRSTSTKRGAKPSRAPATTVMTGRAGTTGTTATTATTGTKPTPGASQFKAEVWADNWFSMFVNGVAVGEDSVPITTERSFNSETFTFAATYPFTLAVVAKDFKQTNSGLEYIGKPNQQMGDGGFIAQITDTTSGKVVAVTDASWKVLSIQRAPLNPSCEHDPEPDKTCQSMALAEPANWTAVDFNDGAWTSSTIWSAAEVGPKDGYNNITWNPSAKFVWATDLHIDNTILLRLKVTEK